jgi:uncharacterized alpha-E superfamily protein
VPGIKDTLLRLRSTVWTVRDRLSLDTWRIFNQINADIAGPSETSSFPEMQSLLDRLIIDLSAFSGMEMENMTRGHGWRFLEIGRRLERGIQLSGIIQSVLKVDPLGQFLLDPLLEFADSSMTYRRRYFSQVQLAPVLDLLLADEGNPRALAFQASVLIDHLKWLPPVADRAFPKGPEQKLMALLSDLRRAEAAGQEGFAAAHILEAVAAFAEVSDAISGIYFTHAGHQIS